MTDSNISDFLQQQGYGTPTAAVALAVNDVVLLDPKGKARPAITTNYAGVGVKNTPIVQRQQISNASSSKAPRLKAQVTSDGDLLFPAAESGGLTRITKALPGGGVVNSITLNFQAADNLRLLKLSNGNFVVSANGYFAIVDERLNVIKAATQAIVLVTSVAAGAQDIVALSGGGFAMASQLRNDINSGFQLAIYDNAGNLVSANTIQTWTGGAGADVFTRMEQLSNGNIVIVCCSNYTTTKGLFHAIYTTAGAQVLGMTAIDTSTPTAGQFPTLLVVTGYYHIASPAGATLYVRDNTGGAANSYALTNKATTAIGRWAALVSDGTSVWCMHWVSNVTGMFQVWKTDLTGAAVAGGSGTYPSGQTTTAYNFTTLLDATTGLLAFGFSNGAVPSYGVIDLATLNTYTALTALSGGNVGGTYVELTDLGDFAFAAIMDASSSTMWQSTKWANAAVIGVSRLITAAGSRASVNSNPGIQTCNPLKGAPAFTVEQIGSTVMGIVGTLTTNAIEVLSDPSTVQRRQSVSTSVSSGTSYTVPADKAVEDGGGCDGTGSANFLLVNGNRVATAAGNGALSAWFAGPGDVITAVGTMGITGLLTNA